MKNALAYLLLSFALLHSQAFADLHDVVSNDSLEEVTRYFESNGASAIGELRVRRNGLLPIDIARNNQNQEIVDFLREMMGDNTDSVARSFVQRHIAPDDRRRRTQTAPGGARQPVVQTTISASAGAPRRRIPIPPPRRLNRSSDDEEPETDVKAGFQEDSGLFRFDE